VIEAEVEKEKARETGPFFVGKEKIEPRRTENTKKTKNTKEKILKEKGRQRTTRVRSP